MVKHVAVVLIATASASAACGGATTSSSDSDDAGTISEAECRASSPATPHHVRADFCDDGTACLDGFCGGVKEHPCKATACDDETDCAVGELCMRYQQKGSSSAFGKCMTRWVYEGTYATRANAYWIGPGTYGEQACAHDCECDPYLGTKCSGGICAGAN